MVPASCDSRAETRTSVTKSISLKADHIESVKPFTKLMQMCRPSITAAADRSLARPSRASVCSSSWLANKQTADD